MGGREQRHGGNREAGGGARSAALRGMRRAAAAAAGILVLGLTAVAAARQPTPTAAAGPHSSSWAGAQPGAEVAFSRQCAGCHGPSGEGGVGPDLRTWAGTVEEATVLLTQGADGMPTFAATLTSEQIDALAVFVDDLSGASAYREYCAACHGQAGEGGVGPSLKTSTLDAGGRREALSGGVGSMPGFGGVLTESEIDALVRRTDGYAAVGEAIFARQCAPCHGGLGQGLTGPALAGSALTPEAAEAIVTSGFGGMPAFGPTFEDGDVAAVVAYVLGLEAEVTTTTAGTTAPPTTTTTTAVTTTTTAATTTSTTTATTVPAATTTEAPEVVVGADAYATYCAACHGGDAEGGTGPPLVGIDLTAEEVSATIDEGKGSMPAFSGVLDPGRVAAIVDFLEALREPVPTGPPGRGADVYREQCAACHGADGSGLLGPSLRATLLVGEDLRAAIGDGNATMPAFSRTLTAEDLESVARYVESLRSETGGPALEGGPAIYRQDCVACHGADGEGGIGSRLRGTALTVNEIIARVYGGHPAGMPAFEGALNGEQVRDVALYVKTFEGSAGGDGGRGGGQIVGLTVAGLLLAGAAAATVLRRRRRRPG